MEKLVWPDRLRILAAVMVVVLHVCAPIPMQRTDYNSSEWWAGNLWCSFSRPSVPIFVMLSGFLLLSRQFELGYFLKKRFVRVIIPALFWMPIYLFYNFRAHHDPATFTDAIRHLIEGPVHYHLWYIYLIVGLYLTYPVIAPFIQQCSEREMWFFLGMCIYGCWIIKILEYFFALKPMLYVELFTNNAIYFVGGYYLAQKPCLDEPTQGESRFKPWPVTVKKMVWVAVALICFGWIITAIGSWYHSKQIGRFFGFYYDYLSPSVTLGAVGWFLLAKYTFHYLGGLISLEGEFSVASFGIYLAHPLVRDWWSESGYWQDKYHPALCIPVVACFVLITSLMLIQLVRAIPGGDKIT